MRHRHAGGLSFIIGLALLVAPLFWKDLVELGVPPVLDPAAAIGAAPGGGYPAAVGGAAMAVGGAVVWLHGSDSQPTPIVLVGGIVGIGLGILAVAVLTSIPFVLAVQIGLAGAAPGFAAVRGAATERTRQRLGTGLVLVSLAPFTVAHIIRGVTVSGMAGFASLLLASTLVVYTAVLSYPFYRLGRIVR